MRFRTTLALSAFLAVSASAPLVAQTVTPANPQGWGLDASNTQNGGTAGISTDQPEDGLGSLEINLPGSSAAAHYTLNFAAPVSLSTFSSASFDWYRDASSTAGSQFTPDFSFDIAYTDVTSGKTVTGELEWEGAYNGVGVAPTNTWVSENLTNGLFWVQGGQFSQSPSQRGPLNSTCGDVNNGGSQLTQDIADWISSSCLTNAVVTGVTIQGGSGWGGTFLGDADDVAFSFTDGPNGNYNFEPTSTTPEPGTMALMATGLVGMAGAGLKRRRNKK